MEKIPTAEETYLKYTQCVINHADIKTAMIEFAKLHVEAALKAASEGQINRDIYMMLEYGEDMNFKKSILDSYPLENIK